MNKILSREELENLDVPCQYIEGKKIQCVVVATALALYDGIAKLKDKLQERIKVIDKVMPQFRSDPYGNYADELEKEGGYLECVLSDLAEIGEREK